MTIPATPLAAHSRLEHIAALDGVRGIAIAMVFVHHYFAAKLLWMGVDLFFVLSGFLITGLLLRTKTDGFGRYIGHFYLRRAQRILPSYLAVLLLCAVFFGTSWLAYWYLYLGGMNFILALGLPRIYSLPLWSLAVEEQFYLLWPVLVYFCSRKTLQRVSACLIVLAPVLRFVCTPYLHQRWAIYALLPFRMDCLAAGALIASLWPSLRARVVDVEFRRRVYSVGGVLAIVAILLLVWMQRHGLSTINSTRWSNTLIYSCTLICMAFLFVVALFGTWPRLFGLRVLQWAATVSYTVYLVHFALLELLRDHYHLAWPRALGLVITLVYATASWFLLERPVLRLGRSHAAAIRAELSMARVSS